MSPVHARSEIIRHVRRVIVKLGSYVLTTPSWKLDRVVLRDVTDAIAGGRGQGLEFVIVSSGAIAAGMGRLGLTQRPHEIAQEQAAAAVGQIRLMHRYSQLFARHNLTVGQVLLTHGDLSDRERFLNARHTLLTLLDFGAIPIINENDTTVVEEIRFGDNDYLSSLVSNIVQADLLVLLTDIDGFYDKDPHQHPDARFVPLIEHVDRRIEQLALGARSGISRGGMATKITAAKTAARYGVPTIIANGKTPGTLGRILQGEEVGTLILPERNKLTSRKHWIAYTLKPQGVITVDQGARRAMECDGRSLLATGIVRVGGDFSAGEAVSCHDDQGIEFARGLCKYGAEDVSRMCGMKTVQIRTLPGLSGYSEVMHRDDLVLLREE